VINTSSVTHLHTRNLMFGVRGRVPMGGPMMFPLPTPQPQFFRSSGDVPEGQALHSGENGPLALPASHVLQLDAASELYLPAVQPTHSTAPSCEYHPPEQAAQLDAPEIGLYMPASQTPQVNAPNSALNVPATQSVHSRLPLTALCFPGLRDGE
jgi:hypothetical protein